MTLKKWNILKFSPDKPNNLFCIFSETHLQTKTLKNTVKCIQNITTWKKPIISSLQKNS